MTTEPPNLFSRTAAYKKRMRQDSCVDKLNSEISASPPKKQKQECISVLRHASEIHPSLPIPKIIALWNKPSYIVGRNPENCDLVLDSIRRNLQISRMHAEIRPSGENFYIRDARSMNGTFVNGRKVTGDWLKLAEGDKLCFGAYYTNSEFFYRFEKMVKDDCPSEAFEYGRAVLPQGYVVPSPRGLQRQHTVCHEENKQESRPVLNPKPDENKVIEWKNKVEKLYEKVETNISNYTKRSGWFISYKQNDGADVLSERLYNQLHDEDNWHDMYFRDKKSPSIVMKAICRRDKFICFLSTNYFNDYWCVFELTTAFKNGVDIVPVFNENKSPAGAGPLLNLVPKCFSKLKENDFVGLSKDMVSCAGQIAKIKARGSRKTKAEFSDSENDSEVEEGNLSEDEIDDDGKEDEEL